MLNTVRFKGVWVISKLLKQSRFIHMRVWCFRTHLHIQIYLHVKNLIISWLTVFLVPAKESHLHVSPQQNFSDSCQFGCAALHLQTLLLHGHLTQLVAPPRLWHHNKQQQTRRKQLMFSFSISELEAVLNFSSTMTTSQIT